MMHLDTILIKVMTKEQVMNLLNKKIENAEENRKRYTNCDEYYYGVIEGLKQAKEIVGMLDNENNRIHL